MPNSEVFVYRMFLFFLLSLLCPTSFLSTRLEPLEINIGNMLRIENEKNTHTVYKFQLVLELSISMSSNEIELRVLPALRMKTVMVSEETGQKYEWCEDDGSTTWLAQVVLGPKDTPGVSLEATDDSWATTTVTFLVPDMAKEGDVLDVSEQGVVVQINGASTHSVAAAASNDGNSDGNSQWSAHKDNETNRTYFANNDTGKTTWTDHEAASEGVVPVPIPSVQTVKVHTVVGIPTVPQPVPMQGNPMMQQPVQGNPMVQQPMPPPFNPNPIQAIRSSMQVRQLAEQNQANYIASIMADEDDMYGGNDVLYTAKWNKQTSGCCCLNNDNQKFNESSSRKPTDEIFVKDRHVKVIKRINMSSACCPPFLQCPAVKTTTLNVNAIHAVVASEKDIGCCTYFMTFVVWFFCGCCGCHYHMHKKRFRQTCCHRFYLFVYFITFGFFLVGWIVDGFRVYYWLQAYSIKLYGEFEEDTILIDVKSMAILQQIRDALYRAMAPGRQLNTKKPAVSSLTCEDQEAKSNKIVKSEPLGCFKNRKVKMIVTKDRLIMHKESTTDGFKNEWTDIFLLSLEGVERTTPEEYPWYYIWMYAFPPWGFMGCHRIKLGHKGCGLRVYQATCGYFGFGYLFDLFTMCCCIQNLRIKSELRMVFQRAMDLNFHMILCEKEDSEQLVALIATELRNDPSMSTSNTVANFHHVKTPALMKCCVNCYASTTTETRIDSLSIKVRKTIKSRRKKMCIPPSPCCPFCWMLRPISCCSFCYVQTREVTDQELYHKTAGRKNRIDDMPNTDFVSLVKIWFFGGLLGCHRFRVHHMGMGKVFIALWIAALFGGAITGVINASIGGFGGGMFGPNGANGANGANVNYVCSDTCGFGRGCFIPDGYSNYGYCKSCQSGTYQGSTSTSGPCKDCPTGYISSNQKGYCKPVPAPGNQDLVYKDFSKSAYSCSDVNGVDLSRDECNEQQRSPGSGWTFTDGECIAVSGVYKGQIICSITCAPGQYNNQYYCESCPAGQFQDKSGKNSCKSCSGGTDPARDKKSCLATGKADKQYPVYFEKTSGFCTDGIGNDYVTTVLDCQNAASSKSWTDTSPSKITSEHRYAEFPRGCTFNPNRASTSRLVFNNPPKPYTTLQECSSESKCVCRRTCQPGTYGRGGSSCSSCNGNQYQSESGKDACETCPVGQEPLRSKKGCSVGGVDEQIPVYIERVDGTCKDWANISSVVTSKDCEAAAQTLSQYNGNYPHYTNNKNQFGRVYSFNSGAPTVASGPASSVDPAGCFSPSDHNNNDPLDFVKVPRIAWGGEDKVMQHFDVIKNEWSTGHINAVTQALNSIFLLDYCKKFWSSTTSVKKTTDKETIEFCEQGESEPCTHVATVDVYECVGAISSVQCGFGNDIVCLCKMTCPPGKYQDEQWKKTCKTCAAGQYQNEAGKDQCIPTNRRLGASTTVASSIVVVDATRRTLPDELPKNERGEDDDYDDEEEEELHNVFDRLQDLFQHPIKDWSLRRLLNSTSGTSDTSDSSDTSEPLQTGRTVLPDIGVYFIYIVIALWLYDLFLLRSMLDTTTLSFQVTEHYFGQGIWGQEWECYLKNDKEAQQVLGLLDQYTSAYQKPLHPTYKQISKVQSVLDQTSTRQRRRSSKSSRELLQNVSGAGRRASRRPSRRSSKSSRELMMDSKNK